MNAQDLSDNDLCEALRCCAKNQCTICPCKEPAIANCMDAVNFEAARRLDHLTEIRAERDACKKELQKLGIKI